MEKRENSSVLRGRNIVLGEIADWLGSARNYEIFRESLSLMQLKHDRARGLFQTYMEYKVPSLYEKRKKEVVRDYVGDVVLATLDREDYSDKALVSEIKEQASMVANAWQVDPFFFEDCTAATPEQIGIYIDLINQTESVEDYDQVHKLIGYKKFLQNQRHDKFRAGETDILNSDMFVRHTGEKISTPNWDMSQYKELIDIEKGSFSL